MPPSKSTITNLETVVFYSFSWLPGVHYSYLETPREIYNGTLRSHTHWDPMYDINIHERTVLEGFRSTYCCDRIGKEQNVGYRNKLVEKCCSCAVSIDDLPLVPEILVHCCVGKLSKNIQNKSWIPFA